MLVFFPKIVFGNLGTLITMLLGAIVCVTLRIVALLKMRRQTISSLLMVVVFCTVCWALLRVSDEARTVCRWNVHKKAYKAQVLAQPSSTDGSLKHVEWDCWGAFGSGDTMVYLVFDPNDSLAAAAARTGTPGKFSGIPCKVWRVRHLENQWYTVFFTRIQTGGTAADTSRTRTVETSHYEQTPFDLPRRTALGIRRVL